MIGFAVALVFAVIVLTAFGASKGRAILRAERIPRGRHGSGVR